VGTGARRVQMVRVLNQYENRAGIARMVSH
jgi:hypothetical protein